MHLCFVLLLFSILKVSAQANLYDSLLLTEKASTVVVPNVELEKQCSKAQRTSSLLYRTDTHIRLGLVTDYVTDKKSYSPQVPKIDSPIYLGQLIKSYLSCSTQNI